MNFIILDFQFLRKFESEFKSFNSFLIIPFLHLFFACSYSYSE